MSESSPQTVHAYTQLVRVTKFVRLPFFFGGRAGSGELPKRRLVEGPWLCVFKRGCSPPPGRKKKTFKTRWSGMQAQRRLIANRTPAPNMPSLLRRNSGKPIGGGRGTESFAPLCKSLLALSRLTFGSDHSATRLVFSFTFCRAHRGRTLL